MVMAMISRVLSAWFAFFIPCYHTWKALSHRPLSEPDLERWAMYWTCAGMFVAFENTAEWFVSWLPFYWELRTLFLLFLALPQTQGSTWFYNVYVHPFFSQNETDIDAGLVSAQSKTLAFLQTKFGALWETLWRLATTHGAQPAFASAEPSHGAPNGAAAQPPEGRANWYALGSNLFQNYGPWAMGAVSKLGGAQPQRPPASTSPAATPRSNGTPSPSPGMQQRRPFFASGDSQSSQANTPPFPTPTHY